MQAAATRRSVCHSLWAGCEYVNKPWWTSDSPGVIKTVFFADRLFYWRTARYPSCRNREPLIPDPIGGTPTPATTMLTETVSFSARATNNGADLSGNYRRIYADIRALDHALISEDLPAARDAFNR